MTCCSCVYERISAMGNKSFLSSACLSHGLFLPRLKFASPNQRVVTRLTQQLVLWYINR